MFHSWTHVGWAMAIYHVINYLIGFVTFAYASLAAMRMRPRISRHTRVRG